MGYNNQSKLLLMPVSWQIGPSSSKAMSIF